MKDGRTHLAYKTEHVVDLETDFVLAAVIYPADCGDTDTLVDSVMQAQTHLNEAGVEAEIEEVAADKVYVAQDVRATLELARACEKQHTVRWVARSGKIRDMALRSGWLPVDVAMRLPEPDSSWMDNPKSRSRFTGGCSGRRPHWLQPLVSWPEFADDWRHIDSTRRGTFG